MFERILILKSARKATLTLQNLHGKVPAGIKMSRKAIDKPLSKREITHKRARPQSWHGETQLSRPSIKGYYEVNGRKMPVFDFSQTAHSKQSASRDC